jgi:hypothetical protein
MNPMQWVDIDFIAFSFLVRKNSTMNIIITIRFVHVSQARANIDVVNEVNYMQLNEMFLSSCH